jgi:hypothetical protein
MYRRGMRYQQCKTVACNISTLQSLSLTHLMVKCGINFVQTVMQRISEVLVQIFTMILKRQVAIITEDKIKCATLI